MVRRGREEMRIRGVKRWWERGFSIFQSKEKKELLFLYQYFILPLSKGGEGGGGRG